MDGNHVKAYIYDLSRGLARTMSLPLLGRQLNGIWHTSIVVFNEEFFFGSLGIESCTPGCTILGQPDEVFDLGISHVPFELFMSYLQELAQTSYKGSSYHLLHHNCNSFTSDVAQFLTGRDIPAHITSLPDEVLRTPFGQMIKPFLDSMANTPGGGQVLFESGNNGVASSAMPVVTTAPQASITVPALVRSTDSRTNNISENAESSSAACACDPVIFRPAKPTVGDVKSMKCCTSDRGALLAEAAEFICDSQASWTISKCHFEAIATILTSDTPLRHERVQLLRLLQLCISDPRSNDSWLLASSSVLPVVHLAVKESTDADLAVTCMETMCNMSSTEAGHKLVTSTKAAMHPHKEKELAELLCVPGILDANESMVATSAALSVNLSRYTISEDLAVSLASALLQKLGEVGILDRQKEKDTVCHMLVALTNLGRQNMQVAQLITVMNVGSDWPPRADRVGKLLSALRETCSSCT